MEGDPKNAPGAGGGGDNYIHDLRLIKVNSDFSFNGNVEMIKLASSANAPLWGLGQEPYVSGFGATQSGGSVSNTLRRAEVKVTSIDDDNKKIIAGGSNNGINYDACQGDSGGPLYASTNPNSNSSQFNVLIGTVNGGAGCGNGGAYMNVSKYLKWIVETIHLTDTPDLICSGTNYQLENIGIMPDGCSLTWTASPSYLFTSSSGSGTTFSVSGESGVSGQGTISITLNTPDGDSHTASKTVWVGYPPININTDGTFNFYGNNAYICKSFGYCMQATSNPSGGISSYSWNTSSWPAPFADPSTLSVSGDQLCFGTHSTGTYLIQVNANGVCGSNQKNLFITVNNCGYRLFPNPATSIVNLEFENPEQPESIPIAVEIYDEKKQKKLKSFDWKKSKSKKKEIDVSDLPRGTHYVKLYFDKKKEVETIRLILE
jgi:Trypsin/Secretion system C-terminal sorting domain